MAPLPLDAEPVMWVAEGSACCVLLITLPGTTRADSSGLGKGLL